MKTETSNLKRLDIVGNGDSSSERDVLTAMLKQWRQKLGYCSIFAAVPAILASHISEARSDEASQPDSSNRPAVDLRAKAGRGKSHR